MFRSFEGSLSRIDMVLFPRKENKSHSNSNHIFGILHPLQTSMGLFPQVVLERGLLSLLLQVRYPDGLTFFLQDRPLLVINGVITPIMLQITL